MTLWPDSAEQETTGQSVASAATTDVIFKIDCKSLPVDHAATLTKSICRQIPSLQSQPLASVHPVHVAGSQNGWERPQGNNSKLLLSKRTRLKIRVAREDAETLIDALQQTTHYVEGHKLQVLDGKARALQPSPTLFSRYTTFTLNGEQNEQAFVASFVDACEQRQFHPVKILCGKTHRIDTIGAEKVTTRSILLADVPPEHSLMLQDHGVGELRLQGCGLFIPNKDINAVS